MKRLFLMKGKSYCGEKLNRDWLVSEKLDGMRCYWDGGITRGMRTRDVPFANVEKDGRYLSEQMATGLWSFYRKPIQAPDWFLNDLPNYGIDGELWMGRGLFQQLISIVKDLKPGSGWEGVSLVGLDTPSYREVFPPDWLPWVLSMAKTSVRESLTGGVQFGEKNFVVKGNVWYFLQQKEYYSGCMEEVMAVGGEGVVYRKKNSFWVPSRSGDVLKHKGILDSEGVVVGYVWGRETSLGSKLLGLMGALIVQWKGKTFKLSGFTDEERVLYPACLDRPGEIVEGSVSKAFPLGTPVTFTYRELTEDDFPKEARFLRKRVD